MDQQGFNKYYYQFRRWLLSTPVHACIGLFFSSVVLFIIYQLIFHRTKFIGDPWYEGGLISACVTFSVGSLVFAAYVWRRN